LGNKLGILDDSQLERLMPKQAENGAFALRTAKTHNHAYTDRVAGAKPESGAAGATLRAGTEKAARTWLIQRLVNTCVSQPGLTTGQLLEHYRGTKESATLEKLSMWDDIADKNIEKNVHRLAQPYV
jgi:DNA primase